MNRLSDAETKPEVTRSVSTLELNALFLSNPCRLDGTNKSIHCQSLPIACVKSVNRAAKVVDNGVDIRIGIYPTWVNTYQHFAPQRTRQRLNRSTNTLHAIVHRSSRCRTCQNPHGALYSKIGRRLCGHCAQQCQTVN